MLTLFTNFLIISVECEIPNQKSFISYYSYKFELKQNWTTALLKMTIQVTFV